MQDHLDNIPKFFVDAMLGNLAKKLRLFGFDTEYSSNIRDSELIKIAVNENRIIISRDVELINKAKKTKCNAVLIREEDDTSQLIQLRKEMKLPEYLLDVRKTRCTNCNGKLIEIEKSKVENLVPKGVLDNNEEFWSCTLCKKIYWKGTHIDNLQKYVVKINEEL